MGDIKLGQAIDPSKPTILYGAGGLTHMALNIWPKELQKPIAIIDKNCLDQTLKINNIPVFNLDFFQKHTANNPQVILSAFKANIFEICKDLDQFGITIAATIYDVLNSYIPEKFSNGWVVEKNKSKFRVEISNISNFFSDQKSQDILEDVYLWRASRTIKSDIYDRIEDELFKYVNPLTTPYLEKATYIIDGGAFDGKSSVQFANYTNKGCQFSLYEPDIKSFENIRNTIFQKFKPKLFNIALTDKINDKEPFFSTGGLSSRLVKKMKDSNSVSATSTIDQETSTISDEIKRNTMIKLHIEGAEFNALLGADRLIEAYKPTWIINCSHNSDQLIETPRFLSSRGYTKLYLRCHSLFGEGLTLYALPD